jgi:DNA-binding response OmpR family regulator
MLNVLIVEDDLTIADLLQEALEADGFHVTGIACTLKEAVQLAEQQCPDFAIVDIRLANGDLGTEFGVHLRNTTTVKVIYSTGNSNDTARLGLSGDAIMAKPYRLGDVGRGLKIIKELAQFGQTQIIFPRNFRLLAPTKPVPEHRAV